MDLILIRHAQPAATSIDDILIPVGEQQAQKLGHYLSTQPITTLLSSPFLRALGTAHIIAKQLGSHPIEVWLELHEGLFEDYHGYGSSQLQERFPLARFPADMHEASQYYEADTQESMFARCQSIIERLQARFGQDKTIVIVSHGGMITYLLYTILQIPRTAPMWFEIDYAGITRVRFHSKEKRPSYPPLYPSIETEVLSINERVI